MSTQGVITRQNQSGHARDLLVARGELTLLSHEEFIHFVDLWSDFCQQGATDEIKKRFKKFDKLILERKNS